MFLERLPVSGAVLEADPPPEGTARLGRWLQSLWSLSCLGEFRVQKHQPSSVEALGVAPALRCHRCRRLALCLSVRCTDVHMTLLLTCFEKAKPA